ncbi:hypothetical protein Tco_0110542 [Tanacetum coccineum]
MTTAPNEGNEPAGPPPVCNPCDGRHFGRFSIKCHKCSRYGHKQRDYRVKVVATGANAQPIMTCFDCSKRGHVRTKGQMGLRLVENDAVIMCGNKVVHVSYGNKTLVVKGDKGASRLKVISLIKSRKYIERGCHLFLAHVTETESKEKRIENVPVIRDFPEVFPNDLPGLPPPRQVEFRIDLVMGATPVARAPYYLAPSEMKELSG